MLKLVDRSRLGRDDFNHASSILVTYILQKNKIYLHDIIFFLKKESKGGCSSIGRTIVCGTVSSLFKSGYPPFIYIIIYT